MDERQDRLRNPLGLDGAWENCPDLAAARERVVHGYGLVDADFLFGERALRHLAREHTTESPDSISFDDDHAREIRGRGFELVPMLLPERQDGDDRAAFLETMASLMDRDYRRPEGRRGTETRDREE